MAQGPTHNKQPSEFAGLPSADVKFNPHGKDSRVQREGPETSQGKKLTSGE